MNKLKLTGTRNIPLVEEFFPEKNKDYFWGLRVALESVESFPQDEGESELVFKMKVINTEILKEIGSSREVKVGQGFSPSQKLRLAIYDMLQRVGKEQTQENYEKTMDIIQQYVNSAERIEDITRLKVNA